MTQHVRRCLFIMALVTALSVSASSPTSGAILTIDFISDSLSGVLSIDAGAPFVPGEFSPDHYGYYFTTAMLAVGPFGEVPTVVTPWQPATVVVQNNISVATTRAYGAFDEFRVSSGGPIASFELDFVQYFFLRAGAFWSRCPSRRHCPRSFRSCVPPRR